MHDRISQPAGQIMLGNIFIIICCAFYLLWWILAFRPTGAVKGIRSGWLLIPAVVSGVLSLVMIIRTLKTAKPDDSFFGVGHVIGAGFVLYFILLIVTRVLFHRQVTTELFLIVGWTVLAFLEINLLYGIGSFGRGAAIALFVAALVTAAVSMVCYILYYGLDIKTGYIDGMIPLILVAVFMAVLAVLALRTK